MNRFINKIKQYGAVMALMTLAGCGWMHQDMDECPAKLRLKFVYDYNIKFADAFPAEVNTVNVWAFDSSTGAPVWSGSSQKADLITEEGCIMETPLGEGTYDFVAWCGLSSDSPFHLSTYTPSSKEDLEVMLKTVQSGNLTVSDTELPGLYHGYVSQYTCKFDPTRKDFQDVTVSLTKDTNAVRVLLQNLDGREIDPADFSVSITDANANLAWDNQVLASPIVTYQPWATTYGVTSSQPATSKTVTTISALLSELSMSRLIAGAESRLTIVRNTDGVVIVDIPFIDYLLLVKGHYGNMTDQEYLDRQDDYSIMFILDATNNWYIAGGIYINSWVVVPPQNVGKL